MPGVAGHFLFDGVAKQRLSISGQIKMKVSEANRQ